MNVEQAKRELASADDEQFVSVPAAVLSKLDLTDVPDGTSFQVGSVKDGVTHLDWSGSIVREGTTLYGEADHTWTRKYWYAPLGLEQYLDLVRRSVETRQRTQGDVAVTYEDDDGAYVALRFRVNTIETNLGRAYTAIRKIADEVEEAAQRAADEIGERIAEIAARLSGWGDKSMDALTDAVEKAATAQEKGRSLEELCSRLFESVPGLRVTQRILTETEEIDIAILNGSDDPRLRREGAVIFAECKNWSSRCGKNEFVVFKAKLENRSGRSTMGVLISWNGFADTVTKEMLRGSREELLVVPLTGQDLRAAVQDGDFASVLFKAWDRAVTL